MTTPDAKRRDTTTATQTFVVNAARRRVRRYVLDMTEMPPETWDPDTDVIDRVTALAAAILPDGYRLAILPDKA